MNNQHVQERKCTSKPVETVSKAFYFVDNLRENVLGHVYSLDLNYDMELKIQGRVHSGKQRITVKTQVHEVEAGRLVQSVRQQSL